MDLCVVGIGTQDGGMVGVDESTELWRPIWLLAGPSVPLQHYFLYQSEIFSFSFFVWASFFRVFAARKFLNSASSANLGQQRKNERKRDSESSQAYLYLYLTLVLCDQIRRNLAKVTKY